MTSSRLWLPTLAAAAALTLFSAAPVFAAQETMKVPLSGKNQTPVVKTAGVGVANITYDPSTREVTWTITYSGLASSATMAHFHRGLPGKNGPVVIWLSKKGSPPSSPITGKVKLTPAQAKQFEAGDWYVNVHTKDHPAGAIRGQVEPSKS